MLKSVFESELVAEMHKGLIKKASNHGADDLTQAVDHLNSAIDIFEEAGMTVQADRLLNLLEKIAAMQLPNLYYARQYLESTLPLSYPTLTNKEMKDKIDYIMSLESTGRDLALFLDALRSAGTSEHVIKDFVGNRYMNPANTAREISEDVTGKLSRMIDEELAKQLANQSEQPGDIFTMTSLLNRREASKKKPKNPLKVSDRHTKKLTSDKMVKNLKHHGTVFNMSDDNDAQDLLNNDILDVTMSDDTDYQLSDFEDEL